MDWLYRKDFVVFLTPCLLCFRPSVVFFPTAIRGMEKRAYKKLRSPFAVHTHKLISYLDFAGLELESKSAFK